MPRALPAEARKGEILDQAFGLFAARGYHALSMRDLARELGASTGVLYHWFPSKAELFGAMLARQVARQVGEAVAAVAGSPDRLAALGRHLAEHADDLQRTLVVALDWHRAEPSAQAPIAAALAAYRAALGEELGLSGAETDRVLSMVIGELLQRVLDPGRSLHALGEALPAQRDVATQVAQMGG